MCPVFYLLNYTEKNRTLELNYLMKSTANI